MSSSSSNSSNSGKSPTSTWLGLTNKPNLFAHSNKGLKPFIDPLQSPVGSSSLIPTQ
jgi:hypothetical protein